MASHGEITVGSVGEWVVRDGGTDVPVAVLSKVRAESGHGYDFVVQRVDGRGQPYGRKLTRGSGSLRRPGTQARSAPGGFGRAPQRNAAPARARKAPERGDWFEPPPEAPAIMPMWPTAEAKRPRPAPRPAAPPAPPALPSLRGRSSATAAPPKPAAPVRQAPNQLVGRVIAALSKLAPTADAHTIRGTVAGVLAADHGAAYYGLGQR